MAKNPREQFSFDSVADFLYVWQIESGIGVNRYGSLAHEVDIVSYEDFYNHLGLKRHRISLDDFTDIASGEKEASPHFIRTVCTKFPPNRQGGGFFRSSVLDSFKQMVAEQSSGPQIPQASYGSRLEGYIARGGRSFHEFFRQLLKETSSNMHAFSDQTGIPYYTLASWHRLNNPAIPTADSLNVFANRLGFDGTQRKALDDLVHGRLELADDKSLISHGVARMQSAQTIEEKQAIAHEVFDTLLEKKMNWRGNHQLLKPIADAVGVTTVTVRDWINNERGFVSPDGRLAATFPNVRRVASVLVEGKKSRDDLYMLLLGYPGARTCSELFDAFESGDIAREDVLVELRYKGGFTHHQLADASGVSRNSIYNAEHGQNIRSAANAQKLAEALGVPSDERIRFQQIASGKLKPQTVEAAQDDQAPPLHDMIQEARQAEPSELQGKRKQVMRRIVQDSHLDNRSFGQAIPFETVRAGKTVRGIPLGTLESRYLQGHPIPNKDMARAVGEFAGLSDQPLDDFVELMGRKISKIAPDSANVNDRSGRSRGRGTADDDNAS